MNEFTKSLIFALVGSLLVGTAAIVYYRSQPKEIDQFAMVGEEFFPDFESSNEVRALEIAAYDFESRDERQFRVEYRDDEWKIASHHDYPAEAADRLDRTTASVLGIRREALAGRRANEHRRFGVVDPKSDEADAVNRLDQEAVGVRISLEDRNGDSLVDYIIGKEVDRQDDEDPLLREIRGLDPAVPLHYVRVPDEQETYVASIQVDVSTSFADWIEPDLLLLEAQQLQKLVINDYSFEAKVEEVEIVPGSGLMQQVRRLQRVEGQEYTLTKPTGFGPWSLEGLDEETEELDTTKITPITQALDSFQILGVAPRYQYQGYTIINSNLELEFPESIRTEAAAQRVIQDVAQDLSDKGFNLSQDPVSRKLEIAADQGELTAATGEGLVYHLYFGNAISGTDREIELGTAGTPPTVSDDAASDETESDSSEGETEDGQDEGEGDESEAAKNRYVLVRLEFDPELLGEQPVPPVKPEPPATESAEQNPEDPKDDDSTEEGKAVDDQSDNDESGSDESGSDESGSDSATSDGNTDEIQSDGGAVAAQDDSAVSESDASTAESNQDEAGEANSQDETEDAQAEYERQQQVYESEMASFQTSLVQYQQRKARGEEKVRLLNERFQDWYYVISAEDLETFTVSRDDLVKPKPKAEDEGTPEGGQPGNQNLPPTLDPPPLDGAPQQPPTELPGGAGKQGDDQ